MISLSKMTLLKWLIFLLGSLTATNTVLVFWIYSFHPMLVFVLLCLPLHWKILIILCLSFYGRFVKLKMRCPISMHGLCNHLRDVLWKISFNSINLLWKMNSVSGFRLELMFISSQVSSQASLISMVFSCLCSSHSSSGLYLGQITSEKQVGTQNRKCPNKDMQKTFKIMQ